jgi:hypothetical protein
MLRCYWDAWNREHATRHGVSQKESEYVLEHAAPPYPQELGGGKYGIRGQSRDGRYLQVIFVYRGYDELKFEEMSLEEMLRFGAERGPFPYIIHASLSIRLRGDNTARGERAGESWRRNRKQRRSISGT